MRRENSNLFSPIRSINDFNHVDIDNSSLGLVLAKRDHTIRSSLCVNNVLIVKIMSINFGNRLMDCSHKLVFRRKWNFSHKGGCRLEFFNINSTKVGSTENGDFRRVTDFTVLATIDTENTLGAQNSSCQSRLDKYKRRRFARTNRYMIIHGNGLFECRRHWCIEGVNGKFILGFPMSTSTFYIGTVLDDLGSFLS